MNVVPCQQMEQIKWGRKTLLVMLPFKRGKHITAYFQAMIKECYESGRYCSCLLKWNSGQMTRPGCHQDGNEPKLVYTTMWVTRQKRANNTLSKPKITLPGPAFYMERWRFQNKALLHYTQFLRNARTGTSLAMKISENISATTTGCDWLRPRDNPEAKVSHYCLVWEELSVGFQSKFQDTTQPRPCEWQLNPCLCYN